VLFAVAVLTSSDGTSDFRLRPAFAGTGADLFSAIFTFSSSATGIGTLTSPEVFEFFFFAETFGFVSS
jgi:hypothetical protein